jgi:hypothetical protein
MPTETSNSPTPALAEGSKRVNVVFTAEQFQKLQNLASSQKITLSDALRQAINLSGLIVDANNEKDAQILFKKGNVVQQLKLVR